MTARDERLALLVQMVAVEQVTEAELIAAMRAGGALREIPTVREFLPVVRNATTDKSARTMSSYWTRLAAQLGELRLDEVLPSHIESFAVHCQEHATRRANAGGGTGAARNAISTARAFFRRAVNDGLIRANPASAVPKPKRNSRQRRALDQHELADRAQVTGTTGRDTELDTLLFRFHLETAARRGGALSLMAGALDRRRQTVTLLEKGDKRREVPVSGYLLEHLLAHCEARSRGAVTATTPVFHYKDGTALTRRHYNSLAERWQGHLPWAARLGVSVHWLRHTALTDVERLCGKAVARALAGHEAGSVTDVYTEATFEEVAYAQSLRTGETHPLAVRPTGTP